MRFYLEGPPIPKARHRYHSRGRFVSTYDPQQKLKEEIRANLALQVAKAFDSPEKEDILEASQIARAKKIRVALQFYMPIAKSLSKKKKDLLSYASHTQKPDLDNLIKFYLDAANGVLWHDDKIIHWICASKVFSDIPRTVIDVQGE